ncbi:MAG: hypothetical protein WBP45_11520 [Daejeonella sp.]
MNKKQQTRVFMMKAVRDTNKASKVTWQNFKPFKKLDDELNTIIAELDLAAEGQQVSTTGITLDKEELAEIAVDKVLHIAKNVRVYALENNKHDLYAQLQGNKFQLLNLPDNEQAAALKAMVKAITPFVAELEDYMITAEVLDDAVEAVAASEDVLTKPRTTINSRSTVTASVRTLLNRGRVILGKMDNLIHNFKGTDPVYVSNFKKARIIIDPGSRSEDKGGHTPPPAV